jgi:hypothetical protein
MMEGFDPTQAFVGDANQIEANSIVVGKALGAAVRGAIEAGLSPPDAINLVTACSGQILSVVMKVN